MKRQNQLLSSVALVLALFLSALLAPTVSAAALPDFREIVADNSPGVVKIIVEQSS